MKSSSFEKPTPLCLFISVAGEVGGQTERRRARQRRSPTLEGSTDRLGEPMTVKVEMPGQEPQIKKIFHAAVGNPELDH
jgi:hypothetical protein